MFRGKYLCTLKKLYDSGKLDQSHSEHLKHPLKWKRFIDHLFKIRWLPFVKETFNGKGNAVRYLARYSYRTAIANSRILSVDDESVTFHYKDYADGSRDKTMTLKGQDFIGRFLTHILPPGFHRMRLSGYLANSKKAENLKLIHRLRNSVYEGNPYRSMKTAELLMALFNRDICTCTECSGRLVPFARGVPLSVLPSPSKILNPAIG